MKNEKRLRFGIETVVTDYLDGLMPEHPPTSQVRVNHQSYKWRKRSRSNGFI
jgi:hypothetical protein